MAGDNPVAIESHPPRGWARILAGEESNYGFFKPTEEVFEAWAKTRNIAQVLKARAIVFQCPAKFTPGGENVDNMRYFLTSIDRGDFILVWEPRGEWNDDALRFKQLT